MSYPVDCDDDADDDNGDDGNESHNEDEKEEVDRKTYDLWEFLKKTSVWILSRSSSEMWTLAGFGRIKS